MESVTKRDTSSLELKAAAARRRSPPPRELQLDQPRVLASILPLTAAGLCCRLQTSTTASAKS